MNTYDLIIVGGGVAGMLCAINSKKQGINNILLIEKDPMLGGSSNLITYSEYPLYKENLISEIENLNIDIQLNTLVININDEGNIVCVSPLNGVEVLSAKAIVLANGSKEKGLSTLSIAGNRCSGVITLKTAKKIFNMNDVVPGKNIAILGNENISLIEEELKLKNINVVANIGSNLDFAKNNYEDYSITHLVGKDRLSSIIISNGEIEKEIECDCLIIAQGLLSDGLVAFRSGIALNPTTTGPKVDENLETSKNNIFACGDGIYIHTSLQQIETESKNLSKLLISRI